MGWGGIKRKDKQKKKKAGICDTGKGMPEETVLIKTDFPHTWSSIAAEPKISSKSANASFVLIVTSSSSSFGA
jgi:hypothetical protein